MLRHTAAGTVLPLRRVSGGVASWTQGFLEAVTDEVARRLGGAEAGDRLWSRQVKALFSSRSNRHCGPPVSKHLRAAALNVRAGHRLQ